MFVFRPVALMPGFVAGGGELCGVVGAGDEVVVGVVDANPKPTVGASPALSSTSLSTSREPITPSRRAWETGAELSGAAIAGAWG
ncbi:hypothetical protein [Mycolicibacterium doricum]|uniref:hypothetical protein n=1 Tax=Mycolicibacterium doricum TaxID=126673 RepID=UPI0010563547|nr:hypothetical protein [Mycolicibacterium doricum]MCV7270112.1 hypothetical protein [Mycolicibacterium doricum]